MDKLTVDDIRIMNGKNYKRETFFYFHSFK